MVLTIYADMLVAVNLYIDFFLLWCVRKVLGLGARTRRLLLGAFLGAVWALLSLLPLPAWAALPLGLIGALLAALGAFAPGSAKLLGKAALCLWLFSFLLAGFCLFLLQVLSPAGLAVSGNVIYLDLSPRLLFLFTCGAYGLFWLWHRLLPRDRGRGRLQTFVVEQGGKTQTLLARGDTGNSLREPFSGLPVVVCQADRLAEVAPAGLLAWGQGEAAPEQTPGLRLVPFTSLGGAGVLPAFRPERVTAGKTGKPLDCYVALYPGQLSAGEYDALFNPDLFPEEAGVG